MYPEVSKTPVKGAAEHAPPPPPSTMSASSSSELAAISVSSRLPEFWEEMPRLWFAQVESILGPQKKGDDTKFDLVVAKLSRDALQQVSDILLSPPESNKYNALKERLLLVYEESAERQFQKLVGEMDLGSQKPSQLLRRMRELGRNAKISEQTLLNLWLARLPTSIRAVLAVSQDQSLENLANIADKIRESVRAGEIAEVSTSASTSNQVPMAEMIVQMQKLNFEVASLREEVKEVRRGSFRGRERGRDSYRSNARSRSRTPSDPRWLCRWHYRYGTRARTCEKPCAWKEPSEN